MHPVPFNDCHFTRLFRPITENNKHTSECHLLSTEILQATNSALGLCFQIYAIFFSVCIHVNTTLITQKATTSLIYLLHT